MQLAAGRAPLSEWHLLVATRYFRSSRRKELFLQTTAEPQEQSVAAIELVAVSEKAADAEEAPATTRM